MHLFTQQHTFKKNPPPTIIICYYFQWLKRVWTSKDCDGSSNLRSNLDCLKPKSKQQPLLLLKRISSGHGFWKLFDWRRRRNLCYEQRLLLSLNINRSNGFTGKFSNCTGLHYPIHLPVQLSADCKSGRGSGAPVMFSDINAARGAMRIKLSTYPSTSEAKSLSSSDTRQSFQRTLCPFSLKTLIGIPKWKGGSEGHTVAPGC